MAKNEPSITITIGILLIIIGVGSRLLTGTSSITALIPAFFGLPIAILGWLALAPQRTKWSMIVTGVLALLGVLGTYSVLGSLLVSLQGDGLAASAISRVLMLFLCGVLLIVCIVATIQGRNGKA